MIELNEPMDKDKKVYLDVVEKQLNVTQNPIISKITKHSKPLREIKFRGKRLIDGTWIYGGFQKTQRINKYQVGGTSRYNTIIPETLGQYVGLHDKNGREIYEGDIVKVLSDCDGYYIEKRDINGIVLFDDKFGFDYIINVNHIRGCCDEYLGNHRDDIEVVGNVWDNPDLLGGSDEECDN